MAERPNTANLMAKCFAQAKIPYVFGYPGDPNIELIEQCRRVGLEFVLACREGTAAFMADAFGQLTGLPGICVSTLGPGSTNLVNGVATALLDRTPMIAISGQMSTRLAPMFTHQYVDQERLFSPVSKWATHMVPEAASSILRKAFRLATAERPGPVHITTATNVLAAEATDDDLRLPPLTAVSATHETFIVQGQASRPAALLEHARRPVILAGISAVRAGCGPSLRALAEELGCPVVVSPKAKGILPENHPYFSGTIDMACNEKVWSFLASADLILAVGFDCVELIKPWQLSVPVVHIDSTPNTDQIYVADVEFVGAISTILEAFRAAGSQPRWTEEEVRRQRGALFDEYYSGRVAGKLNPSDVVDTVREAMPPATIATTDVGSHKLLVGQGWKAPAPQSLLMTNGLSSMGFSLPAAATAKLLDRARPVVSFMGDGGFAMVQSELRVASSLGLGLLVVVFCDNSLHRIELKQIVKEYPSCGTRFDPSDIVKLAEAMGCDGERIDSQAALAKVLGEAAHLTRPLVIEARIDPSQYVAQY